MTSLGRVVALIFAANLLAVTAALLFAIGQPEVATALGALTLVGFVGGLFMAASFVPRERIRSVGENVKSGVFFAIVGGSLVLVAAALFVVIGDVRVPAIFAVTGAAIGGLGAGELNAARMLRRVPTLISSDEEPRALALGANAMLGRTPIVVVATDGRIVWAEGSRVPERHTIRFEDVDRFDVDYGTGTLTVGGAGEALRVRPVPKRELEKFQHLLRGSAVGRPST
jgi:hypothetical protein